MAILDLVIAPDPRLKKISEDIKPSEINDELRTFIADMFDTMHENKGVGLSAVQVGRLIRLVTMDTAVGSRRYEGSYNPDALNNPVVLINPVITWSSEESYVFEEGCLSFPAQFTEIERPKDVKVKFLDEHGNEREELFEGLASVCVQHEIDHLNGIVFVDHASKMKREYIMKKMKKIKKRMEEY